RAERRILGKSAPFRGARDVPGGAQGETQPGLSNGSWSRPSRLQCIRQTLGPSDTARWPRAVARQSFIAGRRDGLAVPVHRSGAWMPSLSTTSGPRTTPHESGTTRKGLAPARPVDAAPALGRRGGGHTPGKHGETP